jgi:CheY-like chemotaxis protein
MGQKTAITPSEEFVKELRYALNHLYDPDVLRDSAAAGILGVSGRFDTPSTLQSILTRAIESLKPEPNAPDRAYAQATYELLLYRYVQQFSQEEIANQLGISVRHLRRQQGQAVYRLASKLWQQYKLGRGPTSPGSPAAGGLPAAENDIPALAGAAPTQINGELDWLRTESSQSTTDVAAALRGVLELIQPLAVQRSARLVFPTQPTGLVMVHPVAFQQILLNLLSMAIQAFAGQAVSLTTSAGLEQQYITIQASDPRTRQPHPAEDRQWQETVRKMVELSGGTLELTVTDSGFRAVVVFRSVNPVEVLVIDDNAEIVTMMQRFAAETRYRVTGTSDPKQAVDLALHTRPDLVVLDIMMPQVDGLQVLSRLRHHPDLAGLPIIICSVLPQKELALSLGASGFIQKPIQRENFIQALDRVVEG